MRLNPSITKIIFWAMLNRVSNLSRLGETVQFFNGETVDEAIKVAQDWADKNGATLSNYYLQAHIGKSESIIVDVNIPQED